MADSRPLVSIIIPVYKTEAFLPRCIESLLNQTYENLEILLVDDGSPDSCGAICDRYAAKDSRIKVLHKENGGVSAARNAALDVMTGEYLVYMDSDDFVTRYYVENLYKAIVAHGADMSISGFSYYHEGEPTYEGEIVRDDEIEVCGTRQCLEKSFYQERVNTTIWGKMLKKSVVGEFRFPVGRLYEDIPAFYYAAFRCEKVAIIDSRDYFYVVRENSITQSPFTPRDLDGIAFFDEVGERIKCEFPELKQAFEIRKFLLLAFTVLRINPREYVDIRKNLWQQLKELRGVVRKDKRVRRESKMIALASVFGYRMTKCLYSVFYR